MEIELNVDRYVKVWIRDRVRIEAENEEEALRKMVDLIYNGDPDVGYTNGVELVESGILNGSEEAVGVDEEDGNVMEIEDDERNLLWGDKSDGKTILNN